jgi:hypothetical protein
MLQRIIRGKGWEIACDCCSEQAELEPPKTFQEAVDAFKELGWRPVQVNGIWEHHCPSCREEKQKDSMGWPR